MKLPKPPWPSAGLETKRRLARRKPNLLKKTNITFVCQCHSHQPVVEHCVCVGLRRTWVFPMFALARPLQDCGGLQSVALPKPIHLSSAPAPFHTSTLPHSHTSTLPKTKTLHGIQGLSRRSIDDHTIWNQYRFWG